MNENLGSINGHIVGRILKETVRRAIKTIRNERMVFEVQNKMGYSGDMDDIFTSADTKAQEIYLKAFRECFPNCGVIGEENNLNIACKNGCTTRLVVDPLDGTRAYRRRQSHGVGTMVAMVEDNDVISAYIGDVNTEEIYGYRPDSDKVYRISELDTFEVLTHDSKRSGEKFHVLLRDPEREYSALSRDFVSKQGGDYEVMGSSIGIWLARLWKREVDVAILDCGFETPWDSTPIIGISLKLGYVFLADKGDHWEEYVPELPTEKVYRDFATLIIHNSNLKLLNTLDK